VVIFCLQCAEVENFLGELATEVQSRLSRLEKVCKLIMLKLKIREKSAPKETAKHLGKTVPCFCYKLCSAYGDGVIWRLQRWQPCFVVALKIKRVKLFGISFL